MIDLNGATVTAPVGPVVTLQASAAQNANNNSGKFTLGNPSTPNSPGYKGFVVWVVVTASSGTPSMTVKLQDSPDGTNFADVANAVTGTITGTGTYRFAVASGNLATAGTMQLVSTITGGTPSLTYSILAAGIP